MGELLTKTSRKFDSMNDLLVEDVKLKKTEIKGEAVHFLVIRLKSTKICRRMEKGLSIEVIEVGGKLCPVRAWRRYRAMASTEDEGRMPCFRTEDGFSYSHSEMNRDLRRIFEGRIHYGKVSGHSFRIGLASLLAESGYSDEGKPEWLISNTNIH